MWAKDYIYGIEKDQRLAKTTKIAMFLNGDGDASIVNGDGLDDFYYSNVYTGLLKSEKPVSSIRTFDIIVSNPPFGVEGFANTVKNKNTNFYLSNFLTKKSDEIECFFIERSLQLLKPNGYGALILPLSFFERDDIYISARKLLLLYSQIVSIVELSNKAFIVTNTNTAIVFFRKRDYCEIENAINNIIKSTKDGDKKDSLKSILDNSRKNYNSKIIDSVLLSNKYIYEIIKELNTNSKCYLAYSGEKKNQEYFMGYRYSTQRNKEGIKQLKKSLMYNVENTNEIKLDSYIRKSYVGDFSLIITKELEKHLTVYDFNELLLTNDSLHIKKPSSILAKHTIKIDSISHIGDIIDSFESKQTRLIDLINNKEVIKFNGLNYDKDQDEVPQETNIKVLTASNMDLSTGKIVFGNKIIHLREDFDINKHKDILIKKYDLIICMSSGSLSHLGKIVIADKDYNNIFAGGFLNILRCNNKELAYALYYRFMSKSFREFVFSKKGQNINNLKMDEIIQINISLPTNLLDFYNKIKEYN